MYVYTDCNVLNVVGYYKLSSEKYYRCLTRVDIIADLFIYYDKNLSGDEIANVNFLTTISHTRRPTSKYRKRDKPTSFNKLDDR